MDCFTRLIAPVDGWKLVIIDNDSTDDTPMLLHAYSGQLPLVALSQPKTGKNRALNAALPYHPNRR